MSLPIDYSGPYVRAGYGFDVEYNFARAWDDLPIELAPTEYAKPGNVIGYITGDPKSPLGFLHSPRVRIHVRKDYVGGMQS